MSNESLWLLPSISLSVGDSVATFSDGRQHLQIDGHGKEIAALCEFLDGDHGTQVTESDLGRELVDLLDTQGWLVRLRQPLSETVEGRPLRTRQLSYFAHIQRDGADRAFQELAEKSVLIIGTGGIGSYAAFHLAAGGVQKLLLNDFDSVESTNLNRQILFDEQDLGRPKVEALADSLNARFSDLELELFPSLLDAGDLSRLADEVDLVLICGEHVIPLKQPEVFSTVSVITAGYFGCEVFVGPVVSPGSGTARWDEVIPERSEQNRLEANIRPLANHWNCSGATINGMGGALLGEAATRLLAPSLGGPILLLTRRYMDMRTLEMRDEVIEVNA